MDYWGGQICIHVQSMCKACSKLGESGGMLPWEMLILDLLLGAIWWNLGLFSHKHNLSISKGGGASKSQPWEGKLVCAC